MGKTKTKSRSVGDSPKPPITIRSTNVKILDDNIAKLEKAIQAGDVSANPSGTAEETLLSTIGIDGKKYELGPSAENTSYDNTDSGLTATDTQGAIDEIAPALTAEGTSYDNTDSGLTATETQAAIDAVNDKTEYKTGDTISIDFTYASGISNAGGSSVSVMYYLPKTLPYAKANISASGINLLWIRGGNATDPLITGINIHKPNIVEFVFSGTFDSAKPYVASLTGSFTIPAQE